MNHVAPGGWRKRDVHWSEMPEKGAADPLKTLAIIVNYKTSGLAAEAARSVVESESMGAARVVVVDNSEDPGEEAYLRARLPRASTLLTPPRNLGFGRACNLALQGRAADYILLLNPDARLLPGCLRRLQKTLLSREKAAAACPRSFWDDDLRYLMPPSCPPSYFLFMPALGNLGPDSVVKRLFGAIWRRHALKIWRSRSPVKVGNLSGGCALLKREAVNRVGGLFDPRYFLYYEDTDLFMRLKRGGWSLLQEPRAEAIHKYDQCDQVNTRRKRRLAEEAGMIFRRTHLTGWKFYAERLLARVSPHLEKGPFRIAARAPGEAPLFRAPFRVETPRDRWLFEWSPNPDFIPAVGRFGHGKEMAFTSACWSMLSPGRYFGRLGGPGKGKFTRIAWEKEEI
ncbi:MAG: glycosyltransferase family 2 protein [Desulfobacterales bacterium]|nr:glycosyltransferase family 2 protein [Desulfobacterales bacterium]